MKCVVMCVVILFFRLQPHVQCKHSFQFTTFCTSAGDWLFTRPAQEEKQQRCVQPGQDSGLDDRARSALCCSGAKGQGLHRLARGNLPTWPTILERAPVNSSQARLSQEQHWQGKLKRDCLKLKPTGVFVTLSRHKLLLLTQPAKSVRFLTDDDSPPARPRTTSWSSGSQVHPNSRRGPPPLEVWAPSLTLGRDGPGIVLKEGKVSIPWKGHDTTILDLTSNPQRPIMLQPSMSAVSAQFSPSRYGLFFCVWKKTN